MARQLEKQKRRSARTSSSEQSPPPQEPAVDQTVAVGLRGPGY